MSKKSRTFQEDVKIDRFDLDQGSEEQSSFYHYWSDKLSDTRFERDEILDRFNYLKAEKELWYRMHPIADQKMTEASIKAMVETDDTISKVKQELNEITKECNQLSGYVTALEHRRSELKNLTNLWIAGYYSGTSRRSSTDDKTDEAREQLNRKRESENEKYTKELVDKNKEDGNE